MSLNVQLHRVGRAVRSICGFSAFISECQARQRVGGTTAEAERHGLWVAEQSLEMGIRRIAALC